MAKKSKAPISERLETGHVVKHDQTVTIRVYHARRKVRGRLLSQCPKGCGQYLTAEEMKTHDCAKPAMTVMSKILESRQEKLALKFKTIARLLNKPAAPTNGK